MAPAPKIGDLQVLRGAAILLVLLEHLPLTNTIFGMLPHPVAVPGWLGVDLFFVISGYVIFTSLARDRFEPLSFFVKRLFRLMPALLLMVGIIGAIGVAFGGIAIPGVDRTMWATDPTEFGKVAASVLGGYFTLRPRIGGDVFGVAWSLSVEDQFYAALTALCLLAGVALRRRAPRVLPVALPVLAAALYLFILLMRWQLLAHGQVLVTTWRPLIYLFFLRFDFLALGVVLAAINRRYRDRIATYFAERGPFWSPILLAVPLALSAVCGDISRPSRPVFGLVMPVAAWCFGLLVLAAAHERALPAVRGWGYRCWRYLGDRSYTIYLFHTPAGLVAWWLIAKVCGPWVYANAIRSGALHAALATLVLLLVVELIYRLVERPLTEAGRRLARQLRLIPDEPRPELPEMIPPVRQAA